tara:strand:+ start:480 stop:668 length:189 start_codon:yes stop_codon:yes gene_type:complete
LNRKKYKKYNEIINKIIPNHIDKLIKKTLNLLFADKKEGRTSKITPNIYIIGMRLSIVKIIS